MKVRTTVIVNDAWLTIVYRVAAVGGCVFYMRLWRCDN